MTSRTGLRSSDHGISSENLWRLASTASVCRKYEVSRPAHGASAPSFNERAGFGTSRSGSISSREPIPPHSGQAPYGLLKENMRGDTSGKEIPQSAHASFSEKVVAAGLPLAPSLSTVSTVTIPSARRSAVSSESARREPRF